MNTSCTLYCRSILSVSAPGLFIFGKHCPDEFFNFPKIDSDAPRQKTVHGGLCLDECVANTIGNYFQCSTQWWMYNKVRSMNWDLCSIGNYTGKLLLLFLVLLFYKVNSCCLSEGNTLKDHTFQLTCLVKWTWSMILGCLQTPKMSTFQQVNRSMKIGCSSL